MWKTPFYNLLAFQDTVNLQYPLESMLRQFFSSHCTFFQEKIPRFSEIPSIFQGNSDLKIYLIHPKILNLGEIHLEVKGKHVRKLFADGFFFGMNFFPKMSYLEYQFWNLKIQNILDDYLKLPRIKKFRKLKLSIKIFGILKSFHYHLRL